LSAGPTLRVCDVLTEIRNWPFAISAAAPANRLWITIGNELGRVPILIFRQAAERALSYLGRQLAA